VAEARSPAWPNSTRSHPEFDRFDLSRLSRVLSGGSPVPPELVRRVEERFGVQFTTVYGQTELSPVVTQTSLSDSPEDKAELPLTGSGKIQKFRLQEQINGAQLDELPLT
jgi:acyl-CoA synthetase (AMP-forming)/AMP-acid ligase II